MSRMSWAAVGLLLLTAFARAQTPLTNGDVVRMVRAQLGTDIILTTIESSPASFDLTPAGLIGLKDAGVSDDIILAMQARVRALSGGTAPATASAPEKSVRLADAKAPDEILRTFKTMLVDASGAQFFGTGQMKAALGRDKGFAPLKIDMVDDPKVADVVLDVSYTFAWDYPFTLKHQNTSLVLLSGKGKGPFSGPKGATSVASELVKLLKPYRAPVGRKGT